MANFLQTTCFMILLGMVFTWPYPLMTERRLPKAYVYTTMEEGSGSRDLSSSSFLEEMNRMMANVHEHFQHMFNWPTFPVDFNDLDYELLDTHEEFPSTDLFQLPGEKGVIDIEKKLDAIQPVCTTTTNTPTTISPRKSRRKKLPTTQTTKCIKELIINGQKHFSEEITTTDDKGVVLERNKHTGVVPVHSKS